MKMKLSMMDPQNKVCLEKVFEVGYLLLLLLPLEGTDL